MLSPKFSLILLLLASLAFNFYFGLSNTKNINQLNEIVQSDLSKLDDRLKKVEVDDPPEQDLAPTEPKYNELITVVKVIDGDTLELENGERLRYIGIDTPEKNDPSKPTQCYAEEATSKNKQLVEGKKIKFVKDVDTRDRYQRLLGFVYLEDGTFVNLELVKSGFAFSKAYPPDTSKQAELDTAQAAAQSAKIGLWSACTILTNAKGRLETNAVK